MTLPIELFCRLPGCDEEEQFETTEASKESDWSKISSLGQVTTEGVRRHRAYCPNHSDR